MTIEADFKELMTQTVTVAPYASQNGYGEPAFGTAVSYTCRIVNKTKRVRTAENKEVISTVQVWLYGSPGISPKDKVTLPDGATPQILYVGSYPDENGAHHQVIYA